MLHITHDNGNHVCLSDGSVYVRQDREFHTPDGTVLPHMGKVIDALITQAHAVGPA